MAAGILGPTLRRLHPLGYSPLLEAEIVEYQEGACRVYRREFVWVSRPLIQGLPQPEWIYMPATLGGE